MADKSILYIEDNFHNRRIVRKILEKQGYTINEAEDGIKGFEILKRDKPPLVLLDISLPGMDGIEIAKRVKASDELKDIFLIALTASAMAGDRERFLEAGCDDYLSKPFKAADLVEMIDTHYKRIIFEGSAKKDLPRNKEIIIPDRMNLRATPRHIGPANSTDADTLKFSSQPKKSTPSEKDSKPEAITPPLAKEKETEAAPKVVPIIRAAIAIPSKALQPATSDKVKSDLPAPEKIESPAVENKIKGETLDSTSAVNSPTENTKPEVKAAVNGITPAKESKPEVKSVAKVKSSAEETKPETKPEAKVLSPGKDDKPKTKTEAEVKTTAKKNVDESKSVAKPEVKTPIKSSKPKAKTKAAVKAAPKAKKVETKTGTKPGKAEKDEKITKGIIEPAPVTAATSGNGKHKNSGKPAKSEKILASEREEMIRTMLSDTINAESIKPPHPNTA